MPGPMIVDSPVSGAPATGRRSTPRLLSTLFLPLVLSSCADIFGAGGGSANPQLRALRTVIHFNATRLIDNGVLEYGAIPVDEGRRLSDDEYVPITIVTSSGDRENARLKRFLCPAREERPFFECPKLHIFLKQEFKFSDIRDRLAAAGGRGWGVLLSERVIDVIAFPPVTALDLVKELRTWPEVSTVEPTTSQFANIFLPLSFAEIHAVIRFDLRDPVPDNGVIEGVRGGTVTATYRQPDGSDLIWVQAIP